MTEPRRLHLHLASCIEDLEKMYELKPETKNRKAKVILGTAQKLLEDAERYREKGDEEYSYVQYMKYLYLVALLQDHPDFKRDKKLFSDLIGPKNPVKAINTAEKLKISLLNRYASQRPSSPAAPPAPPEPERAPPPPATPPALDPLDEILNSREPMITSQQLFALIRGGRRVLVMDTRSAREYAAARMRHDLCISVPKEIIEPGQSANSLEAKLPEESRAHWQQRAAAALVVLLDRDSAEVSPVRGNQPAPLFLLHAVLTKWDVRVNYARPPRALRGGFADWLLRYPHAVLGADAAQLDVGGAAAPWEDNGSMDDMLEDIDYPPLSEVLAPPPGRAGEPAVDRGSKAAALSLYEERDRQVQHILQQQERLVTNSLGLEMERIAAEKEWESLARRRDRDLDAEARAACLLKEQEITSQIMQLENKQYDMEQENQSLRERLQEYQRRESEEAARADRQDTEEQAAKRTQILRMQSNTVKRIRRMEQRASLLVSSRAALCSARAAAEAEARRRRALNESSEDSYMSESGGVSRSHSSPNIAKVSSDEDEPAPAFDRSTKPVSKVAPSTDMRPRDFQPVWGEVGPGLTGLKNLGNTCYMNSIVQCLNNTALLASYFCKDQYMEHLNRTHGTRGAIAEELAAVVRALWSGQYRFIATKDLRNEVGKHQRAFRGCEQQDSHEFLTILMDWLHDDLQFYTSPPNKDSLAPSERAWHDFTKSRESLVLRLFYGQIRSTVQCVQCRAQSATYESFSNLSLELPTSANRCSLADCLKSYLHGERIPGWNCPTCKDKRDAVKKLDISKLPPILVIHFKRFYLDPKEYMCNSYRKKQTYVDFPLEDLDMSQFSIDGKVNTSYNLYAVSNHYGSMEGGHYTAYCKSSMIGKWHKYDDHLVTEISASEVKSSAAYILFYTSCGPRA